MPNMFVEVPVRVLPNKNSTTNFKESHYTIHNTNGMDTRIKKMQTRDQHITVRDNENGVVVSLVDGSDHSVKTSILAYSYEAVPDILTTLIAGV